MTRPAAIFLCDLTGHMAEPWIAAGVQCWLVDPQHPAGVNHDGLTVRVGGTIIDAISHLGALIRSGRVVFVAGFPPCTDVALCGTKHWAKKAAADRYFQAKAAIVAEQCRMVGALSGARWFFENPRSAFSKIFGRPNHKFDPYRFTLLCTSDNYTKDTWLWTGNGFVMPQFAQDFDLDEPDDRIHKATPSPERANLRSATPRGFSVAVFEANCDVLPAVVSAPSPVQLPPWSRTEVAA